MLQCKGQLKPVHDFQDGCKSLNRPGKNGWYCLLASLKWWGVALSRMNNEPELQEDWLQAICDMSMMLEGLLQSHKIDK